MSVINIENFFDFDNHEPINRIAYSEEDAKYKLMCIKAMQDLGMQILIDNVRKYRWRISCSLFKR